MANVYFEVYGCTLNQADADIMRAVAKKKHRIAEKPKDADVIVFVTCTVKGATENKIMERMKRTKKPFVIAGCLYVNRDRIRREIKKPVVIWPYSLRRINKAINAALAGKECWLAEEKEDDSPLRSYTAPILRIPLQQGCAGNCHFCQTKMARPQLKSRPPKMLRFWLEEGIKKNAKEIQLTGMDSGAYGLDNGSSLPELLPGLLEVNGRFKIRLGMINPQHLNRFGGRLLELMKSEKMYKFLHVPVQTGSEKVCREMNRPHTVADFRKWVKKFREEIPHITIATDIIVGYPTETERDFEDTLRLLRETGPDIVNLSKFTARPGTKAALLKQLPTQEIKRRSGIAARVIKDITEARNRKYVGKSLKVLVLEKGKGNTMKGRADNYRQVVVKGTPKPGGFLRVKIKSANHSSLFGEAEA